MNVQNILDSGIDARDAGPQTSRTAISENEVPGG